MIRYALKCAQGHSFESWFQSADAFDKLSGSGLVECPACGHTKVSKALMAPRVATKEKLPAAADVQPDPPAQAQPTETDQALANAPAPVREALERLRAEVEKNSHYVGRKFANEARAMHSGESPERPIHGEANAEEARALLEDGIPILPLPFRDRRGSN